MSFTHDVDDFDIRETWVLDRFVELFMTTYPFVEILYCFFSIPFEILENRVTERREKEKEKGIGTSVSVESLFVRTKRFVMVCLCFFHPAPKKRSVASEGEPRGREGKE